MFSKKVESPLDLAMKKAFVELNVYELGTDEYARTLDQIVKLHKMKEEETSVVSKDTLILAGTNLLGILMIIRHEHLNVIMSRALGILLKPR